MMLKTGRWIAAVLLAVLLKYANCTDPCSSALHIGNAFRSEDYLTDPHKVLLCDMGRIKEGNWYRFDAHTGNKMATSCVETHRCGTFDTMYMNGDSHPTMEEPGPVNATVCENDGTDCCAHSRSIEVKWCYDNVEKEQYFAYQLAAPRWCETAYCVGTGQPCPSGHYYNKVTDSCINGFPVLESKPMLKGPYRPQDPFGEFWYECHIPYVKRYDGAKFQIKWYFNNNVDDRVTEVIDSVPLVGYLYESRLQQHMGKFISCGVRTFWRGSASSKSEYEYSQNLVWMGITASNVTLDGTKFEYLYKLTSTVPITGHGCNKAMDISLCQFQFQVESNPFGDTSNLFCTVKFKPGNDSAPLIIKSPKNTDIITPQVIFLHFKLYLQRLDSIWNNYTIQPIPISYKNELGKGFCKSVTDPHYTTFDGRQFDIYEPGNFILVKSSSDRIFEVHTHIRKCQKNNYACNCGVAVREGNTIIGVDNCKHLGAPFRSFRKTVGTSPSIGTLTADSTGSKMTITMPSGAKVEAHEDKSWHLNVYVTLPSEDFKKTEGLCGVWDNDKTNDFKKKDSNEISKHTKRRPRDFYDTYRLKEGESFFDGIPECKNPEGKAINFCTCNEDNEHEDIECKPMSDEDFDFAAHNVCPLDTRSKRHINIMDDFFKKFGDLKPETNYTVLGDLSWPTPSGITQQEAEQKCLSVLQLSDVYTDCQDMRNFDLSSAKEDCVQDILVSDSLEAGNSILDVFEKDCLQTAEKNVVIGGDDESITIKLVQKIQSATCVNQCSGNGTCVNGICNCFPGSLGTDCSVSASTKPVITYVKPACDWRTQNCYRIKVSAAPVISDLKCRWKVLNHNTGEPTGQVHITNSSLITKVNTYCEVPPMSNASLTSYKLSITLNREIYSEEQAINIYDSKCIMCGEDQRCQGKDNTCILEDDRCYEGSICHACDNAIDIGNPKRSRVYKTKGSDSYICDANRVVKGNFYWFNQYTGNQIAEACVPEYHCRTVHTIWVNGTHPTVQNPVSEADICVNMDSNCCSWSDKVTIRYCSQNNDVVYAYQLPILPYCYMGYCVGSLMPCDDGEQWDTETKQCIDIDECLSNPCINGICLNLKNEYQCNCSSGYTGNTCELEIDECASNPCKHGTCNDLLDAYRCTCFAGYTGTNCNINIDECESTPCAYNGTCKDGVNSYTCDCSLGYQGKQCTEGKWNKWSQWSECSTTCDFGHTIRERSCMVEIVKCLGDASDYESCKITDCTVDSGSSKNENDEAYIHIPKNDLGQVITNELGLKAAISTSVNTYCLFNPTSCCNDIGMDYTRNNGGNDVITSPSLVTVKNGGPSFEDTTILLIINVDAMTDLVSSFCHGVVRQSAYVSLPGTLITNAITANKDNIEQETGIVLASIGRETPSTTAKTDGNGILTTLLISLTVAVFVVGGVIALAAFIYFKKPTDNIKKKRLLSALSNKSSNKVGSTTSVGSVEVFADDYPNKIPHKAI